MQINVSSDIARTVRFLDDTYKKQVPFATSRALNIVAFDLAKKRGSNSVLGKATNKSFRKKSGSTGATKHTRTGFKYTKSSKRNLTAYVYWDESRGDYMKLQVTGGTRLPTRRKLMIPTKNSKGLTDQFGNFKKDRVSEVLENKKKYFSGKPKGIPSAKAGIWQRYGITKKKPSGQRIRMVAAYTSSGSYRPLFPFQSTVEGYVFGRKNAFNKQFRIELEKAYKKRKR